jgi:O-antigen/teichoic acid export membrane protein
MKKLAIIHNFLGGFLNFAFLFFSTIIFLPYYFEFISIENYGIWLTGISLLSLASVLEANISLILTQQLGSKWVNKEISEFSKYLLAALLLGILICILIILATYFLKDLISNRINIESSQISLFSKAFFIYSISLGFGILSSFIGSISQVFLKTKWPPVFNFISGILALSYTIWAVSFQGVLALAWGLIIKNLVYFLFISFYSFLLLKSEKISFTFDRTYLTKIVKSIGLPFLSKVAMTLATNGQNFIIGVTIAATATTIFDITKKVPFIIIMVINMVGVSTFTSFSLFYSEQKKNLLHPHTKNYFTFIRIMLLISLFLAFILGKDLIKIWVGLDKFGGDFLLAMICFTALLDQLRLSLSQQYYTIGSYNFTSITDAFFAVMFLLLVFILIPIFDLYGIVFAGIFANILYFIFCFIYEKYKNISLIYCVLNLSFFKDLIGVIFLTIITKFTYEMIDNYYLKIILVLSSIIFLLLLAYSRYKLLVEFILIKFLKIKKTQ